MSQPYLCEFLESFRRPVRRREGGEGLTAREEEVLQNLARGYSNKEIADMLKLSVDTVRSHLKPFREPRGSVLAAEQE